MRACSPLILVVFLFGGGCTFFGHSTGPKHASSSARKTRTGHHSRTRTAAQVEKGLVPCTENAGNTLVCAGERIEGFAVTPAGDGTFHRVEWRRQFGSEKWWRDIALYDTGLIYFIMAPGSSNVGRWLTLSRWVFPRTQRITVARYPGTLRFEVTDSAGTVWTLAGTRLTKTHTSFAVETIADQKQDAKRPTKSDQGIVGVVLRGTHPLVLEQKVASYSPYTNLRSRANRKKKSTFRDHEGMTCAVKNKGLFGKKHDRTHAVGFLFDTDAQLIDFLSPRCPSLNLKPLRNARAVSRASS